VHADKGDEIGGDDDLWLWMRPGPGGWRLVIKFDFFTAFVVCGGDALWCL
jgi:hypothetical protein